MDISENGYTLKNLKKINLILGKNGCGKSTLLKALEQRLSTLPEYGNVKYITPERGGILAYEPNIEANMIGNLRYLTDSRRNNRLENFRQQTMVQFRNFEMLFFREMESDSTLRKDLSYTFDSYFNKLNSLLDNIEVRRSKSRLEIYKKGTDTQINAGSISSGEAELISLGIELLVYEKECDPLKQNFLFLDSPDVHIHADQQAKLCKLIFEIVNKKEIIVIIATHSTSMIGALSQFNETRVEFMRSSQKDLDFKEISKEYRNIVPIFGAHPLSNIFNQIPIFMVEGEDDERIWSKAVRTSDGNLKINPRSADGEANILKYEKCINQILESIYDNAYAISLRDRDNSLENIGDNGIVKRFKLSCRASENLLLSDDVLNELGISWNELQEKIEAWLSHNLNHPHYSNMIEFKNGGYDRKGFDLKPIRNDLMYIIEKPIDWEIAIGKTLGKMFILEITTPADDSLINYLGKNLYDELYSLKSVVNNDEALVD